MSLTSMGRALLAIPVGIVALGAYGYWQGTPEDLVNAVNRGDLSAVTAALVRDPARVHTKVYPQGLESASEQHRYRHGVRDASVSATPSA